MERTDGINEARDARGLSGRGEDSMNHSIGVLPGTSYSRALPRSSILRSETSVCVSRETMRRGIYNGDVALMIAQGTSEWAREHKRLRRER